MRKLIALLQVVTLALWGSCSLHAAEKEKPIYDLCSENDVEAIPKTETSVFLAIVCPTDVTMNTDPGVCEANVTVPVPESDDMACPLVSSSNDVTGTMDPSGVYPLGHSILNWTVEDCNGITTCQQFIIVNDNQRPVLTKADTAYAQCSEDEIPTFADFDAYLAANGDATDNCELDTMSFEVIDTTSDGGFDPETVIRRYRIADKSGNYDTIDHVIIIEDTVEPEIECDNYVLALSYNMPELLDADILLVSMRDTCGKIVSVTGMRMDDPEACGYNPSPVPRDSIAFCCADVGQEIMIQLFVEDDSGNVASCMRSVTVADNLPPQIMFCVDDITVSCSYPIDTTDLSEFGMMELDQADVDQIILDDPEFLGSGKDDEAYDGMYLDNCPDGTVITESINDLRDCNRGVIERTFTITDARGLSASCTQTITIVDPIRFAYGDITWPEDVDYEDCMLLSPNPGPGPDPDSTGRPSFRVDDICSQPTATYSDLIFDDPTSGCIKVQRKWKVIDWCYYDKLTGDGSWFWYQYIKIINKTGPVLDDLRDSIEVCTPGSLCAGDQTFSMSATDDCTMTEDIAYQYALDINNDGSIDLEKDTSSLTVFLETGTHLLTWKVEDRCGNITTHVQTIIVKECKAPTPICIRGLAASLSEEGETLIWASDFNNHSYDNCTDAENLVFSFSADTSDTSLPLTCDDVGVVEIEMWVTDEAGNQSYCETWIDVQDSHEVCEGDLIDNQIATLSGKVTTENNTPVKEAQINISGPEMDTYQMTNDLGEYAFESLDMHYDYEVIPVKDDNPLEGVSTLDLVFVQQHILGIKELDSPYKLIAADVNNSESVSAIDLIQLRKMILGVYDAFPENNSWRFVDAGYGIIENTNPWPFIEGMYFEDLSFDDINNDFIAVKIGDVNNSVEEKFHREEVETRSANKILLTAEDREMKAGEEVELILTGEGIQQMIAMQWTITIDNDALAIVGWEGETMSISDDHFGILNGEGQHITFAWTDLASKSFRDGSELMKLTFKAKANATLSEVLQFGSAITPAISYNLTYEKVDVGFEWQASLPGAVVLHQNAPNPFIDKTAISFELPQDMNARIDVFDISGKLMYSKNDFYNKGKNTIFVFSNELDGIPGVVYYTLKTEYSSITKKMILLR